MPVVMWLIAALLLGIIEAVTTALVSVWLAIGRRFRGRNVNTACHFSCCVFYSSFVYGSAVQTFQTDEKNTHKR